MDNDESSGYVRIMISAGSVIAVSATLGAEIDEDPRYESIREQWHEELKLSAIELDRVAENLVSFGEAYESSIDEED